MRRPILLAACALGVLGGCDEERFDNRFDPAGSAPEPMDIVVKQMPVDPRQAAAYSSDEADAVHLTPASGAQSDGIVRFAALGGQTMKFEFWKGPGIDGDTNGMLDVRIQDGATYEAWFSPLWMDYGRQTTIENGQVIPTPSGASWYGYLATCVHAMSKGRIPLREWRVVRSSQVAEIQPVDSAGGSLLSSIDTTLTDAGTKVMHVRLRPKGGRICLGEMLGADGVGLDLREMYSFLPLFFYGKGTVTVVFTMQLDQGAGFASRSVTLPGTGRNAPVFPADSFVISDVNGRPLPIAWKDAATHVTALDFCASGSGEFDAGITNIDIIGIKLRAMIGRIGGVP